MNIQEEVHQDLSMELGLKDENDKASLLVKVKNAVYEIRNHRNYPSYFTEADIQKDLKRFYSNIHDLALYDYNQIGAEGQLSHNSNGTSRTWKSRSECLQGVVSMCNVF